MPSPVMRLVSVTIIVTLFSCSESAKKTVVRVSQAAETLKPYQQSCLNILKRLHAIDGSYKVSDSFYLWNGGYVNNGWKPFSITRTIHEGSYSYLFWKQEKGNFCLYKEIKEPKVSFERDTLFDVNGDGYKDFLIIHNSMNGQCQPQFPILFCFDISEGEFVEINEVSGLPNPNFNSHERTISGECECKMLKDVYKVRWREGFKLDTIFYRTLKL